MLWFFIWIIFGAYFYNVLITVQYFYKGFTIRITFAMPYKGIFRNLSNIQDRALCD